jgi:hypothetical protein
VIAFASVLFGLASWSGATAHSEPPGRSPLATIDSGPPPPTVTASIRFERPTSPTGWGTLDLSASPAKHELRVRLVLGTVHRQKKWSGCGTLEVRAGDRTAKTSTSYGGVAMRHGVYDAVRATLSIEDVRRMAAAPSVTASLCGERIALPAADTRALDAFIEAFEQEATYDGPARPRPPRPLYQATHPLFDYEDAVAPVAS